MDAQQETYAARLAIDYPEQLDRVSTALRIIWIIPIFIILGLVGGGGGSATTTEAGETITTSGGGIAGGFLVATALMILFRMRYPRWWFDFVRELTRFEGRVIAYFALLTDSYPSTVDEQSVHLEVDYPHHHDARRTESGGAVYLTVEEMPRDLAAKVKGGVPDADGAPMWADVIVEVDSAGDRVWEWHAAEHLDVETDVITFNDLRAEWSHGNTVVPLPDGRFMFSFRNISTVGIIDKATNEIVWKVGYETLAQQHDPSMLANGNVLIFDNGSHRWDEGLPSSRVVEVDPKTNQTVWEYRDTPAYNFFSPYISGARRLGNGNTLITEGMFGRMFQVTPEGEVVWEYINPHFFTDAEGQVANRVFRATHYMPGEIPWL